jgi:hypothetical protein
VCPTCRTTDWIVDLPIVGEYTFDSESGRIVLNRTEDTPQPSFERVICAPPGRKTDHFPPDKTRAIVEQAVLDLLDNPAGRLFYDPRANKEVAPAHYKHPTVFRCPQCRKSKWLVHTPNRYSWLFNSNRGTLELHDDSSLFGLVVTFIDASCIGCGLLAYDDELAQIAKSFVESYVQVRFPNKNFVVAVGETT